MKQANSIRLPIAYSLLPILYCLFSIACCLLPAYVWAAVITADRLEYFKDEDKYIASGNVRIEKDMTVLKADKIVFYKGSSEAEADGHVTYEDPETLINTEKAEINLETKTGRLYNAARLFKKGNYRINGDNISKIEENHYYASTATFTTCDTKEISDSDWCFKGRNVDIVVGKSLTAHDAAFKIKGLPVLYSPYLWAPVMTERSTGFLTPSIGNSSRKGFYFSPLFFWAIDDNRDATFQLDYYS
ncbi:MAG: hypothetical protein L0Y62_03540, partial [Nitrospirae bacterium]|nr:hypothetical protein [Nitrospirota bacterium]